GGTFFLDELGEMPLPAQAKLLRVLEKREIIRVGSVEPRPIDVRFIAATHRDLSQLVAEGKFRQDLYFRLDGISLRIPPLRARTAEIVPLALKFIEEASARAERSRVAISEEAAAALEGHAWPGNVQIGRPHV